MCRAWIGSLVKSLIIYCRQAYGLYSLMISQCPPFAGPKRLRYPFSFNVVIFLSMELGLMPMVPDISFLDIDGLFFIRSNIIFWLSVNFTTSLAFVSTSLSTSHTPVFTSLISVSSSLPLIFSTYFPAPQRTQKMQSRPNKKSQFVKFLLFSGNSKNRREHRETQRKITILYG